MPEGDCEPKISIMPTTVPNNPINGAMVASVPATDFCRPVVPFCTTATGVAAGMPWLMRDFVQSARLWMPMSTTLVPGICAICS